MFSISSFNTLVRSTHACSRDTVTVILAIELRLLMADSCLEAWNFARSNKVGIKLLVR